MVAVGRVVSRKHAFELGLTGDTISAVTAASWGLINAVVDDADLDQACVELLGRATRGTRESTALGKRTLYAQLDLGQADAYRLAGDVMARSSQTPDAQESMQAFLEKRAPRYQG
jgi:enoyl-CoA hydratase/carnithine racemase